MQKSRIDILNGGSGKQIGNEKGEQKIIGRSHAKGGVDVKHASGEDYELEGGEVVDGDRVFSVKLKSQSGESFAAVAESLLKAKKKANSALKVASASNKDKIRKKIKAIEEELTALFSEQQEQNGNSTGEYAAVGTEMGAETVQMETPEVVEQPIMETPMPVEQSIDGGVDPLADMYKIISTSSQTKNYFKSIDDFKAQFEKDKKGTSKLILDSLVLSPNESNAFKNIISTNYSDIGKQLGIPTQTASPISLFGNKTLGETVSKLEKEREQFKKSTQTPEQQLKNLQNKAFEDASSISRSDATTTIATDNARREEIKNEFEAEVNAATNDKLIKNNSGAFVNSSDPVIAAAATKIRREENEAYTDELFNQLSPLEEEIKTEMRVTLPPDVNLAGVDMTQTKAFASKVDKLIEENIKSGKFKDLDKDQIFEIRNQIISGYNQKKTLKESVSVVNEAMGRRYISINGELYVDKGYAHTDEDVAELLKPVKEKNPTAYNEAMAAFKAGKQVTFDEDYNIKITSPLVKVDSKKIESDFRASVEKIKDFYQADAKAKIEAIPFKIEYENATKGLQGQYDYESNQRMVYLKQLVDSGALSADAANAELDALTNVYNEKFTEIFNTFNEKQNQKAQEIIAIAKANVEKETSKLLADLKKKYPEQNSEEIEERFSSLVSQQYNKSANFERDYKRMITDAEYRKKDLTGKISTNLIRGTFQVMDGIAGMSAYFGGTDFAKTVNDLSRQFNATEVPFDTGEFSFSQLVNPDWWINKAVPMIPFMASLMIPGLGAGRTAFTAVRAMGLTGLRAGATAGAATSLVMRPMESFIEGGFTYMEAMEKGLTSTEAAEKATDVMAKNMNLLVTDFLQATMLFTPIGLSRGFSAAFKQGTFQTLTEGFEEVYQEFTQKRQFNPGITFFDYASSNEGLEVFTLGAVGGLAFGAPSMMNDIINRPSAYENFVRDGVLKMLEKNVYPELTAEERVSKRATDIIAQIQLMGTRKQISDEQAKKLIKDVELIASAAKSMPANLTRNEKVAIIEGLVNVNNIKQRIESDPNMDSTIREGWEARLKQAKKYVQDLMDSKAQVYMAGPIVMSKQEFVSKLNDEKFVAGLSDGKIDTFVQNDPEVSELMKQKIDEFKAKPREAKVAAEGEVVVDKESISSKTKTEVERVIALPVEAEDGATFNIDGTAYEGKGLAVPAASMNTTTEELTPELIADFVENNKGRVVNPEDVKVGIYKFPDSNKVSIDLSVIVPEENRAVAMEFAARAGQKSLFNFGTKQSENTGATGENPMQFSESEMREITNYLKSNKMPTSVTGETVSTAEVKAKTKAAPTRKSKINKEEIQKRKAETESKIKRKDLFEGVGEFSSSLGGSDVAAVPISHTENNGIELVEYAHPETGSVDVIVTGTSENDFVGFYRLYENGKPTNKWSSKFENQSRNKEAFKTMISSAQALLPEGHEYTEKTSISTDGLRIWGQQLDRGYSLQYDENGNLITNSVAINGDAIVNELGIPVNKGSFENIRVRNKEEFEKVKSAILPYIEKFGLTEKNIKWISGNVEVTPQNEKAFGPAATVKIDLPVLRYEGVSQEAAPTTKAESRISEEMTIEEFTPASATYDINNIDQLETEIANAPDSINQKILADAASVIKALGNVAKGVKMVLHSTNESYNQSLDENLVEEDAMRGRDTSGYYIDDRGVIHINLKNIQQNTIYHEGAHPVLEMMLASDPTVADKMFKQIKSLSGNASINEVIQWAKGYDTKQAQKKETIVEFIARVADGRIDIANLDKGTFNKVKEIINEFLDLLFPGMFPRLTTPEQTLSVLANIADALKTGRELQPGEIVTPSAKKPKIETEKSKENVFFHRTKFGDSGLVKEPALDTEEYNKKVKGDNPVFIVESVKNILVDKKFAVTFPDDLYVGDIIHNGKVLSQADGGFNFVTKYGEDGAVWASTVEKSTGLLGNNINKSLEENGDFGYSLLVKGTDTKHKTSLQAKGGFINVVLALTKDMPGFQNVVNALGQAYDIFGASDYKKIKTLIDNYVSAGRQESGQTMKEAANSWNLFLSGLVKIAPNEIGQAMKSMGLPDYFFNSVKLKKGEYAPTRPGLDMLFNLLFAEDALRELPVGAAYAAIRVSSKVSNPIFEESPTHPSYNWILKTVDNSPVNLIFFKEAFMVSGNKSAMFATSGKEVPNSWGQVSVLSPRFAISNESFDNAKKFPMDLAAGQYSAVTGGKAKQVEVGEAFGIEELKKKAIEVEEVKEFIDTNDNPKPVKKVKGDFQMPKKGETLVPKKWKIDNDGEGNFLFYHYGNLKGDKVDPKYFGKNRYTSDQRLNGVSYFYTRSTDQESMVSGDVNVIKVPMEKVYPFNTDPLNFYDQAEANFRKDFPNGAFDAVKQIDYMNPLIQKAGFDMTVAQWETFPLRAETTKALPIDKKLTKALREFGGFDTADMRDTFENEIINKISDVANSAGKNSDYVRSKFYASGGSDASVIKLMKDPILKKIVGKSLFDKWNNTLPLKSRGQFQGPSKKEVQETRTTDAFGNNVGTWKYPGGYLVQEMVALGEKVYAVFKNNEKIGTALTLAEASNKIKSKAQFQKRYGQTIERLSKEANISPFQLEVIDNSTELEYRPSRFEEANIVAEQLIGAAIGSNSIMDLLNDLKDLEASPDLSASAKIFILLKAIRHTESLGLRAENERALSILNTLSKNAGETLRALQVSAIPESITYSFTNRTNTARDNKLGSNVQLIDGIYEKIKSVLDDAINSTLSEDEIASLIEKAIKNGEVIPMSQADVDALNDEIAQLKSVLFATVANLRAIEANFPKVGPVPMSRVRNKPVTASVAGKYAGMTVQQIIDQMALKVLQSGKISWPMFRDAMNTEIMKAAGVAYSDADIRTIYDAARKNQTIVDLLASKSKVPSNMLSGILKDTQERIADYARAHWSRKGFKILDLRAEIEEIFGNSPSARTIADKIIASFEQKVKDKATDIVAKELGSTPLPTNKGLKEAKGIVDKMLEHIYAGENAGVLDTDMFRNLFADKYNFISLSPKQLGVMRAVADAMAYFPPGSFERRKAMAEAERYVAKLQSGKMRYAASVFFTEVFYNNVLSGYSTILRASKGVLYTSIGELAVEVILQSISNPKNSYLFSKNGFMFGLGRFFNALKNQGWDQMKQYFRDGVPVTTKYEPVQIGEIQKYYRASNAARLVKEKGWASGALFGLISPYWAVVVASRTVGAVDALIKAPLKEFYASTAAFNELLREGMDPKEAAFFKRMQEFLQRDDLQLKQAEDQAREEYDIMMSRKDDLKKAGITISKNFINARKYEILDEARDAFIEQYSESMQVRSRLMGKPMGTLGFGYDRIVGLQRDVPGMTYLMPFVRVPSNAINEWASWSPYGIVRGVFGKGAITRARLGGVRSTDTKQEARFIEKQFGTSIIQFERTGPKIDREIERYKGEARERGRDMLKGILGTSMWGLMMMYALGADDKEDYDDLAFRVTYEGPEGADYVTMNGLADADKWRRSSFRVKVGKFDSGWISYLDLPFAAAFAQIGFTMDNKYLSQKVETEEATSEGIMRFASSVIPALTFVKSQSYLQGLLDFFAIFGEGKVGTEVSFKGTTAAAAKFSTNFAKSLLYPNLFRQSYVTYKSYVGVKEKFPERVEDDLSNVPTVFWENLLYNVPWAEDYIKNEQYDRFGLPVSRSLSYNALQDAALDNVTWTMVMPKTPMKLMKEWANSVSENKAWRLIFENNIAVPRVKDLEELSFSENIEFKKRVGQEVYRAVLFHTDKGNSELGIPALRNIKDRAALKEILDQWFKMATNEVRQQMIGDPNGLIIRTGYQSSNPVVRYYVNNMKEGSDVPVFIGTDINTMKLKPSTRIEEKPTGVKYR